MSYYRGDLAADLAQLENESFAPELQRIGKLIGYGRAQQILQVLWAKHLDTCGYPTIGALLPEPLDAQQPASAQPVAVAESKPAIGTKPVRGYYFLCQCDKCGWLGSSEETNASIDYFHGDGDYSCPVCGTVEPEEVDSAASVFNAMLSAAQREGGV